MKGWIANGRVVDPSTGEDQVRDVFFEEGKLVAPPADPSGWPKVDATGKVVCPGFVELHSCVASVQEAEAAVAGGFSTVLTSPANAAPIEKPSVARDLRARLQGSPSRILIAGALTAGLKGEEIADVGSLLAAGCAVLSNGVTPVRNARVLRHLLEYAGRFRQPIHLRAADADLESGGVVREGPRAAWLGLPYVPPEAEEIGITTAAALVRRTGTPVHLTHLWSARGVEALRRAQAEGLPITGSTTATHLFLTDAILDELAYAGVCRTIPPLGDEEDRAALKSAVTEGRLAVAADHRPVPPEFQDREFELAQQGMLTFEMTFSMVSAALGSVAASVRALSTTPAALLGQKATLTVGAIADIAIVDPNARWTVRREALRSLRGASPLVGRELVGRVDRLWVGGVSRL